MKVISFYSDPPNTTIYTDCSRQLREDLLAIGTKYYLANIPFPGTWLRTCWAKPGFIEDHLDEPVVWLDVDSRVLKPLPQLDPTSYDIAAPASNGVNTGLISIHVEVAMLYVNNTRRARAFIKRWRERCEECNWPVTDHYHFLKTWEEFESTATLRTLPRHYCQRERTAETVVLFRSEWFPQKQEESDRMNRFHEQHSRCTK